VEYRCQWIGRLVLSGQSVTLSTSLTLFAQWTPVPDVVLSFDANGGTGSLSTMSGLPGATVAMPGPRHW